MRSRKPAADTQNQDPRPYDGPLRRIDGTAPFNRYLWPLQADSFYPPRPISGRYLFSVIALNNGHWLADGDIASRQYQSRSAALRASAAHVIWECRWARRWPGPHKLTDAQATDVIAWVYSCLAESAPTLRPIPAPPANKRETVTLLDLMEAAP